MDTSENTMSARLHRPSLRAALLAACLGLAGTHVPAFAANDLPIVAQTCPKQGRDPSSLFNFSHSCGVSRPDDFAANPSWNVLELMAIDAHPLGGGVVATLYCMSRTTGALSAAAKVRSGPTGTTPTRFSARLPAPLDFNRCAYFVRIDVDGTTAAAQALMVSLRN
jgi:hypothetical protein